MKKKRIKKMNIHKNNLNNLLYNTNKTYISYPKIQQKSFSFK